MSNAPRINQFQNGKKLSITHSEFIGTFDATTPLTNLTYKIYPGNSSIFPWLSSVAPAYETYLFSKLIFRWVPECGTSTAGSIYIAVDYDASDEIPSSIRDLMSMESAVSGSVWSILKHSSKVGNLRKMKTYYTMPSLGEESSRTTSVGSLFLVRGRNANPGTPLGKLFVDYSIELMTPQPEDPASDALAFRATSGTSFSPFGSLNSYAGMLQYGIVNNYEIVIPNGLRGVLIVNSTVTAPGAPSYILAGGSNNWAAFRVFTMETEDGYAQIILFSALTHGVCSIEYSVPPELTDVKSFFYKAPINLINWSLSNMDHIDIVPWGNSLNKVQSSFRLKQYSSMSEEITG